MNNEYFLSINDVGTRLDVPAHTLRYWEKQFPTIIKPTTGAGGRRYYRTETVGALEVIKELLYNRGMTIAGVKKMLKDGTFPDRLDVAAAPVKVTTAAKPELLSKSTDIETAIDLLERAKAALV